MAMSHMDEPRIARSNAIHILGAAALSRYTSGILSAGFQALGWAVSTSVVTEGGDLPAIPVDACVLLQIHGAPHSLLADERLLRQLLEAGGPLARANVVVLLHRPDEVQHSPISALLTAELAARTTRMPLVFLGDMHVDDVFFRPHAHLTRHVVAHGFFEARLPLAAESRRVVIGTHTVFGPDLRSVEHVVRLLLAVFAHTTPAAVLGVVGGTPDSAVSAPAVQALVARLLPPDRLSSVCVVQGGLLDVDPDRHCILVQPAGGTDAEVEPVFNTQLFHWHGRVRTGESSGAVHTRANVPVIFELNGTDRTEQLRVVRVPYHADQDANDAHFEAAGRDIAAMIASGSHLEALQHNAAQAARWTPAVVAREYAALFDR